MGLRFPLPACVWASSLFAEQEPFVLIWRGDVPIGGHGEGVLVGHQSKRPKMTPCVPDCKEGIGEGQATKAISALTSSKGFASVSLSTPASCGNVQPWDHGQAEPIPIYLDRAACSQHCLPPAPPSSAPLHFETSSLMVCS